MAKRSYNNNPKGNSGRKMVLVLAMIVLLAVLVWRVGFYTPKIEQNNLIPTGTSLHEEPEITIPPVLVDPPVVDPANTQAEPPVQVNAPEPEVPALVAVPKMPGYDWLEKGIKDLAVHKYIEARKNLTNAVELGLDEADQKKAFKLLNQAADEWLFSTTIYDGDSYCKRYTIVSGDSMVNIGKKFNIPLQLIAKINHIKNPDKISLGQNLKVVEGPFHLKVNRSKYYMLVYLGDVIARVYPVGMGAPDRPTPTGLWRSQAGKKQENPAWPDQETGKYYKPDDPDNPLGERWIGLEGLEGDALGRDGFGIHGTIKPEEIGHAASRGCIRLLNENVEELYDMVTDGQTKVWVYDEM